MKKKLPNQPAITTSFEDPGTSEQDKYQAILKNLQTEFGISEDELASMLNGEHFNHQY